MLSPVVPVPKGGVVSISSFFMFSPKYGDKLIQFEEHICSDSLELAARFAIKVSYSWYNFTPGIRGYQRS